MAIAIWPVLMIILGILIFVLSRGPTRSDAREIGRAMMWAGFFGLAIAYAGHVVHIG